jgi:DNA modification methylase
MHQPSLFRPEALIYNRFYDGTWDFRGVLASEGVYGIHPYPAMFHFGVVRRIIQEYSRKGDWILDPFMGSGVVAVEAFLHQRHFVGYDLNPLAVLIAQVRTTPLPKSLLLSHFSQIEEAYKKASPRFVPSAPNLSYWFDEETLEALSRLHAAIGQISDPVVARFFWVVFSAVVRQASLTDPAEFKLIRRKEKNTKPVPALFRAISLSYIERLGMLPPLSESQLDLKKADARDACARENPERFDLILTSPPYGDSRTTVAYGQFSRLSSWWLGYSEDVDASSLGSRRAPIHGELPSSALYEKLAFIQKQNPRRAEEVFGFYEELYKVIRLLAPLLKRGKSAFILVGNRRVCGIELPTDKICADFFTHLGYTHEGTYVRLISNKRMPAQNSPTNIAGRTEHTMKFEYLVHVRRRGG